MTDRIRILVVDDDPDLRRAVAISLHAHGFAVRTVGTAHDALGAASESPPDLVVVDLGLPDRAGTEVIDSLRGWTDVPILVLSGRSDSADKVEALDLGADDYVTKPFSMDELLARLRAMVRRAGASDDRPIVEMGDITIDLAAKRVTRDGDDIHLTPTEWHLIEVLSRNPGTLMSRRVLLREAWGPGYESADGNLRLYMAQLRKKLESDPARPRHLLNEPGLGYRFQP